MRLGPQMGTLLNQSRQSNFVQVEDKGEFWIHYRNVQINLYSVSRRQQQSEPNFNLAVFIFRNLWRDKYQFPGM
jgi:hypothetical protein